MVGHVMICRLSGLAVVILLPIRVPVAREASFRRNTLMELDVMSFQRISKLPIGVGLCRLSRRPDGLLTLDGSNQT